MKSNSFFPYFFLISVLTLLASCDNDSNEIGANIVGDDNFEFGTPEFYPVNAYTQALGPVETSNLSVQQFGIYNNPVFGKTTAHVVAQLQLAVENPTAVIDGLDLAKLPKITSVVLTVPYFSHLTETVTDANEPNKYELDSIYGAESKLDLQIYESTYYQRDIDPVTGLAQKHYSDQLSQFTAQMGSDLLNDKADAPAQNTAFIFDKTGKIQQPTGIGTDLVATKVSPRMEIELDSVFFKNKIFTEAGVAAMINNNVFKNYFRGLHFKVAASGSEPGNLAMMDFSKGVVTITYSQYATVPNPSPGAPLPTRTQGKKLLLNLSGNSVNLFENEYTPTYSNVLAGPTNINGDEKLYLKGGEGSMAVIELFKNAGELKALRDAVRNNWLVNDASLSFYVENSTTDGMGQGNPQAVEPNRVYLYDLNNKRALIDYSTDQSVSATSIKYNKKLHGGIIEKASGRGTQYKIRITNHIRRLIANDTIKNIRLGLVVTENINTTSNKSLKTPKVLPVSGTFDALSVKDTPLMSISNPFGTILWGSGPSVPEDKKVKLTIYYTKPN
jgi:hypothetical protein